MTSAWNDPSGHQDSRTERTTEWSIAGCRLALAFGGLIGIYLDPSQPSQGDTGYLFLMTYVAFSLLLFILSATGALSAYLRRGASWFLITIHVVELILVCLVIVYTEGPSSPFFVYFTFVMLLGTLRWQAAGALITGALLSLVLIVLTSTELIARFDRVEIDRLIVRNVYILVSSVLFALLGTQLQRSQQRKERLQLAHKLHDETLQVLTAAKLSLHSVATSLTGALRQRLIEIGRVLEDEQRNIRHFVDETRRGAATPANANDGQTSQPDLDAIVTRLRALWRRDIQLRLNPNDAEIPARLSGSLHALLSEGVANAVVHGGATHIEIALYRDATTLHLNINDNGSGMRSTPTDHGNMDVADNELQPRSIRSRVNALRGSLRVTTSAQGTQLSITFPL